MGERGLATVVEVGREDGDDVFEAPAQPQHQPSTSSAPPSGRKRTLPRQDSQRKISVMNAMDSPAEHGRIKKASFSDLHGQWKHAANKQRSRHGIQHSGGPEEGGAANDTEIFDWIKNTFTTKTCNTFIRTKTKTDEKLKTEVRVCGCGRTEGQHEVRLKTAPAEGVKWSPKEHVQKMRTNALGSIEFNVGGKTRSSQFVRVDNETNVEQLYNLFIDQWKVPMPNIIISVTGGAMDFNLKPELSLQFKRGLVKAASNTGAWIVTGGTNTGVMAYVGQAIADQPPHVRSGLTLIGFATWGVLYGTDKLTTAEKKNPKDSFKAAVKIAAREGTREAVRRGSVLLAKSKEDKEKKLMYVKSYETPSVGVKQPALDPNHTHFVLADDGTIGQFGKEINLRAEFESFVADKVAASENTSRTIVCVLLEGGPNSLKTVYDSFQLGIPIVIAEESGRASDIIAYAIKNCRETDAPGKVTFPADCEKKLRDDMKRDFRWGFELDVADRQHKSGSLSQHEYEARVKAIEEKVDQHYDYLIKICRKEFRKFVTIFSIKDVYNNDLDKAILGALLRAMQKEGEEPSQAELETQLKFAVKWNRADTAMKYIFDKKRDWKQNYLKDVLVECMLNNKHEFVKLLLENGVHSSDFARVSDLEGIFSLENTGSELMMKFLEMIRDKKQLKYENRYLHGVGHGVKSLMGGGFRLSFLTKNFAVNYELYSERRAEKKKLEGRELTDEEILEMNPPMIEDPCVFFLIWAVIMGYQEQAMIFWAAGDEFIAKALIAMRMYKSMAETMVSGSDQEEELLEHAEEFGEIALSLLNKAYKDDEDHMREMMVAFLKVCATHSIFGLAELADHETFIAHPSSQNILNEIWSGAIKQTSALDSKVVCALFCPPLMFFVLDYDMSGNIFDYSKEAGKMVASVAASEQEQGSGRERRISSDDDGVRASQIYDAADAADDVMVKLQQGYVNTENESKKEDDIPFYLKFYYFITAPVTKFFSNLVMFFVFLVIYTSFVLGDLPSHVNWETIVLALIVLSITTEELRQFLVESGRPMKRLEAYFSNIWNWLDFTGIFLFWIAFAMHYSQHIELRQTARFLFIIDIFFWYLRLLNIFTISKRLGPLVTVILNMLPIIAQFFTIWFLFMASFGVVMAAIIDPQWHGDVHFSDFARLIYHSYWQTYGELFLDVYHEATTLQDGKDCTLDHEAYPDLPPCPFLPLTGVVFLAIYMIAGNILLLNLLIAIFTSVYEETNSRSLIDWKNKRMALIVEYHTRPALPPPFTIFYHIYLTTHWKIHMAEAKLSKGLTIPITDEKREMLHLFEEEQKEAYMVELYDKEATDVAKQIRQVTDRVDQLGNTTREQLLSLEDKMALSATSAANLERQLNDLDQKLDNILGMLMRIAPDHDGPRYV